ncbi:MAG: helix-turn-helix domain-containing protein [Kiloniellales bacterium]|nr:helix-turn-helix domain-containing protein [Kiloniellales bacterium]
MLALAVIYDGGRRGDAAEVGGVGLQVIRDWVLRFNAEGPDGLIDRKAPGRQAKLDDGQRQALARRVEEDPVPAVDGVARWRLKDLARWLLEEFGVSLDERSVSRELKALGFRKLPVRPHHHAQGEHAQDELAQDELAQDELAQDELAMDDALKKTSPPTIWRRSARAGKTRPGAAKRTS